MSRILTDIEDSFKVSEPIFEAELSKDCDEITFNVVKQYTPSKEGVTDPVALLMIEKYSEYFDKNSKKFVKHSEQSQVAFTQMFNAVVKTYIEYSPLKNPKQSRLYKWLNSLSSRYNNSHSEGFILLYRYIMTNRAEDCRFYGGKENPHVKNVIAILEKMRDKYEA